MAKLYYDQDADLTRLNGKTIAILGFALAEALAIIGIALAFVLS